MLIQNLPASATDYDRLQRREHREAVSAVRRQWRRMGADFDASWAQVAPTVATIMATAQRRVAAQAVDYIPAVLEDTGQARAITAAAEFPPSAVVGVAGSGADVMDVMGLAVVRAKQSVAAGASPHQALQQAGRWATRTAGTILSDTARVAESVEIYTRPVSGYVRMLTPPSCGRCVILAGRHYRKNQGFERHPGCDCKHIPASEAVAGDLTVDPQAYFESLDEAGQVKLMGSKANAQAIRDGADMGQVINAYRKTAGMQVAQVSPIASMQVGSRTLKFTTEGTTRRGSAYASMRSHGAVKAAEDSLRAGERYARAKPVRVMPETIYRYAENRDEALRLLKLYGWIL